MVHSLRDMGEAGLLAAIFDLIKSREMSGRAEEIRNLVKMGIELVEDRWDRELVARPALTAGDSVEFLVGDWRPVTFFFHYSLTHRLRFRVGLGAGRVDVIREFADECDGPAFWSARDALERLDLERSGGSVLDFEKGEGMDQKDRENLLTATLTMAMLAEMPDRRLTYCFRRVWFGEGVSDIARRYGVSKGNVSKTLRGTGCFILSRLVGDLRGDGGL